MELLAHYGEVPSLSLNAGVTWARRLSRAYERIFHKIVCTVVVVGEWGREDAQMRHRLARNREQTAALS